MNHEEIINLAAEHGLRLRDEMSFNEMGADFRVVFATDVNGKKWVLRIPRREDLTEQIEHEKSILQFVKTCLSVSVPDWQIATEKLVAYPLLKNEPILTYDPETYEVTWNVEQHNDQTIPSLAKCLVELHQIPVDEAKELGLKTRTTKAARQDIFEKIETVKRELGINLELELRWRKWVDNDKLWPDFSTFIHGDLYAGHILADSDGTVTGIIDWSEGQVGDPAVDLAGHIAAFGEESLRELIRRYEEAGGKTWERMFDQAVERQAASPLNYAFFALKVNDDSHIAAAKSQLGLGG